MPCYDLNNINILQKLRNNFLRMIRVPFLPGKLLQCWYKLAKYLLPKALLYRDTAVHLNQLELIKDSVQQDLLANVKGMRNAFILAICS